MTGHNPAKLSQSSDKHKKTNQSKGRIVQMTVKAIVSRRSVLQGAGAAALAAPLYAKSALASSGEINIL
ncbi:twin-arginine translocation signal domain-containing protein, partial [Leisingera sp. D0M16]|uniref:twin-arginine translocation signal domain-containing protein n=1 Tax=Leisingera coralii TaxID=3351347 RepID=UPI003B7B722F